MQLPPLLEGEIVLTIRTRPSARKTTIKELLSDGSIKIDVAAPAQDNEANRELIRFIADSYGIPISCIEIIKGSSSRLKAVRCSQLLKANS